MNRDIKNIVKRAIEPLFYRIESYELNKIKNKVNPKKEFIYVYNLIFYACIQLECKDMADAMYSFYFKVLFKYYAKVFLPKLKKTREIGTIDFLVQFIRRYQQNQCVILGLQRIFSYLDRFYLDYKKKNVNVKELSFILYKKIVFDYFKNEIRALLLCFIRMGRWQRPLNRKLVKKVVLVFINLGKEIPRVNVKIYKQHFRKHLKMETKNFFRNSMRLWLKKFTESHFLIQYERTLQLENDLFSNSLNFYGRSKLVRKIHSNFLRKKQNRLVYDKTFFKNIIKVLEECRKVDLNRISLLFNRKNNRFNNMLTLIKN